MSYTVKTLEYPSANGSDSIWATLFIPDGDIRGILQIAHGMCEHIGRYEHFMGFCAENGFAACGNDHVGHGRSSSEDTAGFFGEENGHRTLVTDVHTLTQAVKQLFPNKRLFLYGHSMGSFIARLYISKYAEELDGVILSGTGGPKRMARIVGVRAAQNAIRKYGPKSHSDFLDNMTLGQFNRRFAPARTKNDWLTRDETVVDTYTVDPFCNIRFTVTAYRDLFVLNDLANRPTWMQTVPVDLPLFLMAGDQDPVGDFGRGVVRIFNILKNQGLHDISLLIYPGSRHEILNELNRSEVYEDIIKWLRVHLYSPKRST